MYLLIIIWGILIKMGIDQNLACFRFEDSLSIAIADIFNIGLIFWSLYLPGWNKCSNGLKIWTILFEIFRSTENRYRCLKLNFLGVPLGNKIIQVSCIRFYNTSSVYCIVCSPPQVMSPFIPRHLCLPPPLPFPLAITMVLSVSMNLSFFLLLFA